MLARRRFLELAGAVSAIPSIAAPVRRPNIVVILADDQGWGDLSISGNSNLSTPNIDSLARDGALFDRFFVCPVCSPTRAEFLTGRYHPRSGVRGTSTGAERMNLDETTIADCFKSAGYATGAFGKWHNGSQHPYHPNSRGFDEFYGFTSGHWGHYFEPELDRNGEIVRGEGYITDDLTTNALRFIERNRARPFFCYLPLNTPHSPMQVPGRFYEKFAAFQPRLTARNASQEDLAMTRAALAMCENIDWNVGRVLSHLETLNLARDTVVLYFSDNGPNSWRWNGSMKGRKASVDEGGVRAPCLFRWPGQIPAGTRIPQIAGAIDLLPTFADLAGIPSPSRKPLDGRSLKPLLTRQPVDWPDRMIFSIQNKRSSVRTQRYRLDPAGQLFDMQRDPNQDSNVAAEQPETAAKLQAALAAWTKEMLAISGGPDTRPYPVGYARNTMLPARDGVPHGGIQRSSIHPNCSFFRNWTSKADSMTWDIETARSGDFEATLHYTCPAHSIGATVELSFLDSRVQSRIAAAHDPPLTGSAQDRAPRSESFVKDFLPLRIGRIRLAKGRGQLTLRATEIPGKEVADVRYVALRLLS
jgi:arylsulfatase A-like enzyme